MTNCSPCLWAWSEAAHHGQEDLREKSTHFMVTENDTRKRTRARVPHLLPGRIPSDLLPGPVSPGSL